MTDTRSFSDEFTYVDKSSGRRVDFSAKPDEAMVTFRQQRGREAMDAIVAESPVLSVSEGINRELGFAAVHVEEAGDVATMARSLEAVPQVSHSIPVMIDEHGAARYFVPDEITVQFRSDVDDARARELIEWLGSRVVRAQRTPGYYTVAVPADQGMFQTIRRFSELPEVAFAEPSEVSFNSKLAYIPDDPEFGQLWGLHNTGQTVNGAAGTADADIDATEAWDLTRGHPDVIVAVIDTGADMDHRDLAANILPRGAEDWDFADAGDPEPEDQDGHGTHVCGTVAAVDNGFGVIGVAPGCRLMPLRVDLTTGMNQNRADAINYVGRAGAGPSRPPLRRQLQLADERRPRRGPHRDPERRRATTSSSPSRPATPTRTPTSPRSSPASIPR